MLKRLRKPEGRDGLIWGKESRCTGRLLCATFVPPACCLFSLPYTHRGYSQTNRGKDKSLSSEREIFGWWAGLNECSNGKERGGDELDRDGKRGKGRLVIEWIGHFTEWKTFLFLVVFLRAKQGTAK